MRNDCGLWVGEKRKLPLPSLVILSHLRVYLYMLLSCTLKQIFFYIYIFLMKIRFNEFLLRDIDMQGSAGDVNCVTKFMHGEDTLQYLTEEVERKEHNALFIPQHE